MLKRNCQDKLFKAAYLEGRERDSWEILLDHRFKSFGSGNGELGRTSSITKANDYVERTGSAQSLDFGQNYFI